MQPKRRGLWLTIIGAIIMLPVAFGIFIAGTVFGISNLKNLVDAAPVVAAGSTHDFQANSAVAMFGSDKTATCSVTDPSGGAVTVDNTSSGSVSEGSDTFNLLGSFDTTSAGAYKIDCGIDVRVLSGADAADVGKKLVMPILVGFGGAALAGLIGLIMLIVGIVKLVRSNRERTAWAQQGAYNSGYQQPQQYGQQGYQQPGQQQPPQYGQNPPPPPPTQQ